MRPLLFPGNVGGPRAAPGGAGTRAVAQSVKRYFAGEVGELMGSERSEQSPQGTLEKTSVASIGALLRFLHLQEEAAQLPRSKRKRRTRRTSGRARPSFQGTGEVDM